MFGDHPRTTLDTHTQASHKGAAILRKPRISIGLGGRYFGLESCLPDHFSLRSLQLPTTVRRAVAAAAGDTARHGTGRPKR